MRAAAAMLVIPLAVTLVLAGGGCVNPAPGGEERDVRPAGRRADDTPVRRALLWLSAVQTDGRDDPRDPWTWSGSWPERVSVRNALFDVPVRESSAGVTAYVHHALTKVTSVHQDAWRLDAGDRRRLRVMRRRAARYLARFRVVHPGLPEGLFGWWPPVRSPGRRCGLPAMLLEAHLGGPRQHGVLQPPGIPSFPPGLRVWPDADDTALVRAALAAERDVDEPRIDDDWALRDDGTHGFVVRPLGHGPTGAWLTWRPPAGRPATFRNDVDLAVNANALWWLARAGLPDAPGSREAERLIDRTVATCGCLQDLPTGLYYPHSASVAYVIARAAAEGPRPALHPAARRLARLVAAAGRRERDERTWGPPGQQAFQTACAVLVLASVEGFGEHAAQGARALARMQDAGTGAFPEEVVCFGRTSGGVVLEWRSAALVTALSVEALVAAASPEAGPGTRDPAR